MALKWAVRVRDTQYAWRRACLATNSSAQAGFCSSLDSAAVSHSMGGELSLFRIHVPA